MSPERVCQTANPSAVGSTDTFTRFHLPDVFFSNVSFSSPPCGKNPFDHSMHCSQSMSSSSSITITGGGVGWALVASSVRSPTLLERVCTRGRIRPFHPEIRTPPLENPTMDMCHQMALPTRCPWLWPRRGAVLGRHERRHAGHVGRAAGSGIVAGGHQEIRDHCQLVVREHHFVVAPRVVVGAPEVGQRLLDGRGYGLGVVEVVP